MAKDTRNPKTRVRASVLRGALKDVLGVVEGRNAIPILDHVLLAVTDQRITLTATDLDIYALRTCASDDRDGPASEAWLSGIRNFAVTLPAKPLAEVLGKLDGDAMVTIEAPDDLSASAACQIVIKAGRARFRLHSLPVDTFPVLPPMDDDGGFDMPCSRLADVLAAVDHAISSEETRYYLNGIYLHPESLDLRFAATDGHRLARYAIDGPDGAVSFPGMILATKTIKVLEKLLAAGAKTAGEDASPAMVEISSAGSGQVRFAMPASDGGDVEIQAKTIDGTFPDYARIIPQDSPHRATVVRSTLIAALERVSVLASDKTRIVKVVFAEDAMTLSAASIELGEASEDLACVYGGDEMTLGFDSKYWLEALGALAGDDVALCFDAGAPMRIEASPEAGALVQVVMPCRV